MVLLSDIKHGQIRYPFTRRRNLLTLNVFRIINSSRLKSRKRLYYITSFGKLSHCRGRWVTASPETKFTSVIRLDPCKFTYFGLVVISMEGFLCNSGKSEGDWAMRSGWNEGSLWRNDPLSMKRIQWIALTGREGLEK